MLFVRHASFFQAFNFPEIGTNGVTIEPEVL